MSTALPPARPPAPPPALTIEFRRHIPELDGLRGVAILLVMFHHLVLWRHQQAACTIDRIYAYIAESGWVGVDFFFVLSGFLITGILVDAKADAHYFRNFYARRVLRIFPLYYLVLVLLFVVFPHMSTAPADLRDTGTAAWSYWSYLSNFTVLRDSSISEPRLITWSLAIEEQFYLLWPAVVWFCNRRALPWVTAAILVGSISCRVLLWRVHRADVDYFWTPSHLDGLAMGAAIAVLVRRRGMPAQLHQVRGWLGVFGLVGTAATVAFSFARGWSSRQDPIGQIWLYTFVAMVGASLLVTALDGRGRVSAVLRHRSLRFFGKYSYGLYLYHVIILAWVAKCWSFNLPTLGRSRLLSQSTFLLINIALTSAAALMSWQLFEKHFLKLKAYFPETSRAAYQQPANRN